MEKGNRKNLLVGAVFLSLFILWTILISIIDLKAIGPNNSTVGLATLNNAFHNLTGVNLLLYNITDWLGLVPIIFVLGFGFLGLVQWIRRKSILKVDFNILILGGYYIVVMAIYLLFEEVVINYRPILINGILEASYPSSTTMLVLTVMPTAISQFNNRFKNKAIKKWISLLINAFIIFMVAARVISGVHWISDIIGGVFLSVGLVMLYRFFSNLK